MRALERRRAYIAGGARWMTKQGASETGHREEMRRLGVWIGPGRRGWEDYLCGLVTCEGNRGWPHMGK